jgi:UDP-glucuronate decarboxylase
LLVSKDYEVIAIDNLHTGSLDNIQHLLGNKKFQFIEQDVTKHIDIDVDGIFNLACPASPVHYQKDPVRTVRTNIMGSLNLLELATKNKCRIIQASTSEVYGDPLLSPQSEEYWGNVNPIGIRSCYDEGKRVAETLFFDYHRQLGTDIGIARIFNTFGTRMSFDDGRVVSNFILQSLRGENLTIFGEGLQTRSFCYVSDLVAGLLALFEKPFETGPINLGNPRENTILELATIIKRMTSSKSQVEHFDLPSDDPRQRKPDITKAMKILDWSPRVSMEEGISKTILDFTKRLKGATK